MLYIMRHGEAVSSDENWERPLTADGVQDITKLANFLKQASIPIAAIYHSDKVRSKQTAQLIANAFSDIQEFRYLSCLDPEQKVTNLCQAIPLLPENILLVGHLPNIELLCNHLLNNKFEGHSVAFHPGTATCLIKEGTSWIIQWVVDPALL